MKKFSMDEPKPSSDLNGATFLLDLPTKGLFYPENHPFYKKETVEIKMMTTKEEEILTNPSYVEKGVTVEKLLESIVLEEGFQANEIFETDKLAILIGARIDAYGEDYPAAMTCISCEKEYTVDINLSKILANREESEIEKTDNNSLIVELPKSKKVVEFRVLLPSEISSIERTVEKMKKLNINANLMTEFYKRIVLSIDGDTNRDNVNKFVENLKIMDSRFLTSMYYKSLPVLNTNFMSACSHCGHEQEGGMPIQANFFFPEF
jgi:hypothetical protein